MRFSNSIGRSSFSRDTPRPMPYGGRQADVEQALSLDPNVAYAHNVNPQILASLGRRNEAIAEYKKALAIEPDMQESVQGLKDQRGKP